MSGDQLDLDAIEARLRRASAEDIDAVWDEDVPALVAEVRRLQEELSKAHFVMGTHAMRAMGIEPPE